MSWNWRNRKSRLLLGVAVVACILALARPLIAHAGYPLESEGRVVLGFGSAYTSAEATASSTHRGIDISAERGARVLAPLAGTVTFSGRVPAVGGGTVRAVAISTASGPITLLPLSSCSALKGDSLAEGDAVGTLADGGDGSCAQTHLHVGVKHGDLYVDPLSVLTLPVVAPESPSGSGGGAGAEQGSADAAAAAATARAAASARAAGGGAHSRSGAHAGAGSPADAAAPAPSPAARPAMPGARVAPGVSVGGVAPQAAPSVAEVSAQRALAPLRAAQQVPAQAQAGARVAGSALNALVQRVRDGAGRAAAYGGVLTAAVLGGVGLLWPLWRREEQEGSSQDRVSAIGDDVAAAVGR